MKMYITIASVDHNGYNGRDHHPTNDMIGLQVLVEKMWRENAEDDDQYAYYVFEGTLEDGRRVQLIDHEIKTVPLSSDREMVRMEMMG